MKKYFVLLFSVMALSLAAQPVLKVESIQTDTFTGSSIQARQFIELQPNFVVDGHTDPSKAYFFIIDTAACHTGVLTRLSVCQADSAEVSVADRGNVTYSWTGPGSFAASGRKVKVPVKTSGTFRYFVTNSLSCPGRPDTVEVTVRPKPATAFSFADSTLCMGTPDAAPKAVPPGSFFTAGAGLVIDSTKGIVSLTRSQPGTYQIKNKVTTAGCADSTTYNIVVMARPEVPVITGACEKPSPPVTLGVTDNAVNNNHQVTWLRNQTFLSNSRSISADQTGIYRAVFRTTEGCYGDTASVDPFVTRPEITTVPAVTSICSGDSVRLISNVPSGVTWKRSGSITPLSTLAQLTVKTQGSYILDINYGNCSGSDTVTIAVTPTPAAPSVTGPDSLCPGGSLKIQSGVVSTANLQWVMGGTEIKDSIRNVLTVTQPGTYRLRAGSGGCYAYSNPKRITLSQITTPVLDKTGIHYICSGATLSVTINNYRLGQDQWFEGTTAVTGSSGKARTLPVVKAGIYRVVRSNTTGCKSASDSVEVRINQPPKVKILTTDTGVVCRNVPVTYLVNDSLLNPNDHISWYVNGRLVQTGSDRSILIDTLRKTSLIKAVASAGSTCTGQGVYADSIVTRVNTPFQISASVQQPTCFNKNGSISLKPDTKGYKITAGNLTAFQNPGLGAGLYQVTIRDSVSGCTADTSYTLSGIGAFTYAKNIVQPACNASDGSLTITPVAAYRITGSIDSTFTPNLAAGLYPFEISLGACTRKDTANVLAKGTFRITAAVTQPTCTTPGSIYLNTVPRTDFAVSGALQLANNTDLNTGTYLFSVTDTVSKCTRDTTIILSNPEEFSVKIRQRDTIICETDSLIPLTDATTSAVLSYTWLKDNAAFSTTREPALKAKGAYVLVASNLAGCSAKDTITISHAPTPVAEAGTFYTSCNSSVTIKGKKKAGELGTWRSLSQNQVVVLNDSLVLINGLKAFPDTNFIVYRVTKGKCYATDTVRAYYASRIYTSTDSSVTRLAGDTISIQVAANDTIAEGDFAASFQTLSFFSRSGGILDTNLTGTSIQFITNRKLKANDTLTYNLKNSCGFTSRTGTIYIRTRNVKPKPRTEIVELESVTPKILSFEVSLLDSNRYLRNIDLVSSSGNGGVVRTVFNEDSSKVTITLDYTAVPYYDGTENIRFRLFDGEFEEFLDIITKVKGLVKDRPFNVYNAVSHDGDGKNDIFEIEDIDLYPDNNIEIFNRWGDRVYAAKKYDNVTVKFDGKDLPSGTYYYILDKGNGDKLQSGYLILKKGDK